MANKSDIKEIEADISFDDGTTEKISLDSSEFDNIESGEKEKQEALKNGKASDILKYKGDLTKKRDRRSVVQVGFK